MKNKLTATVLALFLGGIGFHHFYLGQTKRGLIYLIFCWTLLPTLFALYDFLVFLFMSEDTFNRKYNYMFR